jgi:hypothetical protein
MGEYTQGDVKDEVITGSSGYGFCVELSQYCIQAPMHPAMTGQKS